MKFNPLKIKALILTKGINQEILCGEIGVTKQTLINYFNGRSKIDTTLLAKICDYFNVTPGYFYDVEEPETAKKTKKYIEQRVDELEVKLSKIEELMQKKKE
ncbi:MAG: helix-turn-helix domain-containing protein [Vicingaceae bacterium]|nr:helix-turn-helix domain-containing protein [Vicingaceae bacterium]